MTNNNEFASLRARLGLTQAEAAERLGLTVRGVQDMERREKPRMVNLAALERLALYIAVERSDPMLAPAGVRREAFTLVHLSEGK